MCRVGHFIELGEKIIFYNDEILFSDEHPPRRLKIDVAIPAKGRYALLPRDTSFAYAKRYLNKK